MMVAANASTFAGEFDSRAFGLSYQLSEGKDETMSVTQSDIQEIKAKLLPLFGKKAWDVSLGVGSFITIEFGNPVAPESEEGRTHGEWHLWVCSCAWRLEEGDEVLAGSDDPRETLQEAIRCIEGLSLQSVELFPPAPDVVFRFGDNVVLRLFPCEFVEESEHWMLFTPDENVLTLGEEGGWTYLSAFQVPR